MLLIKRIFMPSLLLAIMLITGCQKKDYFDNTGVHTPNFQGSVMDFLESRPDYFDSLTKIIRIAGMEEIFDKEEITFFAPADSTIRRTIAELNERLRNQGKNQVYRLEQIKPEVWRSQLSRYLFKGKNSMNEYPQLDPGNLSAHPGQIYASYDGDIMNIGVFYNDAGSVRYAGYRQLQLSFIPSATTPRDYNSWYTARVATVNIAPANGYVHVLRYPAHYFGFEPNQFIENAIAKGIN